jgi:glycogen debranching enzyme
MPTAKDSVSPRSDLIRLVTRPHQLIASCSRTVWIADNSGMITNDPEHGVYVHETRVLSRLDWRVNGGVYAVEASNVRQHSVLTYAIARPRRERRGYSGGVRGRSNARNATEETIELRLATALSDGFHQDVDVRNYTTQPQPVELELAVDADFMGLDEVIAGKRRQTGRLERNRFRDGPGHTGAAGWSWHYQARHGRWHIDRASRLAIRGLPENARLDARRLRCSWTLAPGANAHLCVELSARIEQTALTPHSNCYALDESLDPRTSRYLAQTTRVSPRPQPQSTLERALQRARDDLASLRVFDLDRGTPAQPAWVPAAGIPNYVATFGRDILTAAWQSALFSPAVMRGALTLLHELQGSRTDHWRDEEPGKMLHEAHTGPMAALNYRPQGRYYGSFNTSPFYIVVLSEFYHWTGDKPATLDFLQSAERALAWMERHGHPAGGRFYSFTTRSRQGVKNQGWKDSGDALIYPDGEIVPDPIATCEIQGYAYEAKLRMAELYWIAGDRAAAARVLYQAHELKKRFNDAFWMPEHQYLAMALDRHGRQVKSIGSDPGDALATGIVAAEYAPAVTDRLFATDMFSGWGVRTLSSQHIAFNPYSYHRGSVWPAENAAIGVGLRRYGFTEKLAELVRAQMAIAERFQFVRLPEVICGHGHEAAQPFPPVYPKSCSPQAWSAGAPIIQLQMLLGLYPYAPAHTLFLDPHLPEWLPEVRLENLRVGDASADLDFRRRPDGTSKFEMTRLEGTLRLVHQPSPWSLFATPAERVEDFVESLLAA